MIRCSYCHQEKNPAEFNIRNRSDNGKQFYCRECCVKDKATRKAVRESLQRKIDQANDWASTMHHACGHTWGDHKDGCCP